MRVRLGGLISRHGGGRTDLLAIESGGEEEAGLFLRLGVLGDDWRGSSLSPSTSLSSQLLGSRSPFRRVALDPFPGVAGRRMVDLVCVSRERFFRTYESGHPESNGTRPRALPWTNPPLASSPRRYSGSEASRP